MSPTIRPEGTNFWPLYGDAIDSALEGVGVAVAAGLMLESHRGVGIGQDRVQLCRVSRHVMDFTAQYKFP